VRRKIAGVVGNLRKFLSNLKARSRRKTRTTGGSFVKPKVTDLNLALAFCLPLTEQFTNCASKRALELCEAIYPPFYFF
jgi:hypothetical protein